MRNLIRDYFYYNRRERNGIFVLCFLCLVFFLIPKLFEKKSNKQAQDFSSFSTEIASFENSFISQSNKAGQNNTAQLFKFDPNTISEIELQRLGLSPKLIRTFLNFRSKGAKFFKKEDFKKIYGLSAKEYARLENYIEIGKPIEKQEKSQGFRKTEIQKTEPFEFNPNTVSYDELIQLGFPKRAANNLIKFRKKGGTFWNKESLSKIYGVDERLFEKLFPFIIIEKQKQETNKTKTDSLSVSKAPTPFFVDINTATIEDWKKLYGIGSFYAKEIYNLKESLGGFHSFEQIKEVYNFPDSTFKNIKPYLQLLTPHEQLNLNKATVKDLAKHPYIKTKIAKIIINYRDQHGAYKKVSDLAKTKVINPELLSKIAPYFFVE